MVYKDSTIKDECATETLHTPVLGIIVKTRINDTCL